jgi:hypothetical protein
MKSWDLRIAFQSTVAVLASTMFLLAVLVSCEGDAGPQGPQGEAGEAGYAGFFWDDFEGDDVASPPWELSGDALWHILTSQYAAYGEQSLESGEIGDNQSSTISITLSFPEGGVVFFQGGVNSEEDSDWFRWTLDGETKGSVSGSTEGGTMLAVYERILISPGEHTIAWIYEKDEAGSQGGAGGDRAILHAVFIVGCDYES